MRIQRHHVLAAAITAATLFLSDRSVADPTQLGDPSNPASSGATGVFAEGNTSNAQPDPVSGTMRYEYPFDIPRARGLAQPRLGLTYSSSSHDREAGYGWGLDIPVIERRPMSGNPRFEPPRSGATSDERFFFDGQALVRICTVPTCPPGETHPDWATGWRYYRLQVEGMFARFYLSADLSQWRVQLKGGERMDFGVLDGSTEATEVIGTNIVRWRLARHLDALHLNGGAPRNYVRYRWQKLGVRGLAYLTDIFDTPRPSTHTGDLDFAHHTQLVWEQPGYPQTSYADPLHATPDLRLARVGVSSKTWLAASAREVLRIYRLRYLSNREPLVAYDAQTTAPLWHHSFLRTIEVEGACRTVEDGAGNIPTTSGCRSLPPTTFHYQPAPIGVPGGVAKVSTIQGGPADLVTNRRVLFDEESANVVDFNRDGMPDVVQSWPSGPRCGEHTPSFTSVAAPLPPAVATGLNDIRCTGLKPGESDPSLMVPFDLGVAGSSRLMIGYLNRGTDTVLYSDLKFAHQCMDGGFDLGLMTSRSPAKLNTGRASAFFTAQGGSTVVGAWSTGAVTWVPDSIPNFEPRAFVAEPLTGYGGEGSGCDPANFDPATYQGQWRWTSIDDQDWAKKGASRPGSTGANWFADVDGDGLVDEIVESGVAASGEFKPGYVHFTRRFAANEGGTSAPIQKPFMFEASTIGSSLTPAPNRPGSKYSYVDINGDGLVDLVVSNVGVNGGIPRVRLGDGRGSFSCDAAKQPWPCVPAGADITPGYDIEFMGFPGPTLPSDIQFHDVTGDGLADMVQYQFSWLSGSAQGQISLWVNVDGRRFACASPTTGCVVGRVLDDVHGTFELGPHRMTFADMNADRVDDLVVLAGVGVLVAPMLQRSALPHGQGSPTPGLLTRIDNGLGATTQIEYKSIQHLDVEAEASPAKWTHHSRAVEAVVTKITTRDTSGVNGTTLSDPYRFNRTVLYGYADPAYDRWTRQFSGFRKVVTRVEPESAITVTTNWFGACQNDRFDLTLRCAETSDDGAAAAKAKTGKPVRIDRYIPAVYGEQGSPEKWLWSRSLEWHSEDLLPAEERSVTFAYVADVRTTHYDDALPVGVSGPMPPTADGSDAKEPPPFQLGSRQVIQRYQYDKHGNLVRTEDRGAGGDDTWTITLASNTDSDTPPIPAPELTCSADWVCNPTHLATFGYQTVIENGVLTTRETRRKLRLTYELPGNAGGVALTEAFLDGVGSTIQRQAPAPFPPGSAGVGWRALATAVYDAFGNLVQSTQGPNSAAPMCRSVVYDPAYEHLPAGIREHTSGCGSFSVNTTFIYDRGFERVVSIGHPSMAVTSIELDPFGRTQQVYLPQRDGALGITTLGATITYHDVEPLPHVEMNVFPSPGAPIRSVVILNGLGEQVLKFDQGDATTPWVLQGFAVRDSAGRPIILRRPADFGGDPLLLAANATPPPMSSDYVFQSLDGFGRVYLSTEVSSGLQYFKHVYHPLAIETRDAEQLRVGGPHSSAFTRIELDGHGRARRTIQHVGGQDIITSVDYLPTGEPVQIARAGATGSYSRSVVYDSLGRLRANTEPNVGEWRYAWDDAGRLVGTSDARGCGKNIHYDGIGRIVGEDYAPCTGSQPAYSAPDPTTGTGFEVFNRYDSYEAGQMASDPPFAENARLAAGRLVATRDRGSYTRFNYDARGAVRRLSRRVAKPEGAGGADPYVPDWLSQRTDFDNLNRPTRRTAGITIAPLGPGEETYSYSTRGLLSSINSTYGSIVSSIAYEPDGAVRRIVYGDAAATQAVFTYGMNSGTRRLDRYEVTRNPPPGNLWLTNTPPDYPRPDWRTTQTELARFEYEYDRVGNPRYIHDNVSPAQYSDQSDKLPIGLRRSDFDDLYRLTEVSYFYDTSDGTAEFRGGPYLPEVSSGDNRPVPLQLQLPTRVAYQAFSYDFMGNLTSSVDDLNAYYDRSIGTATYGAPTNGPNQLRSADGITATHDEAGNLTELKVTRLGDCTSGSTSQCAQWFAYDWDEVGQLVRARRWDYASTLPPGPLPSTTPAWTLRFAYSQGIRVLKSDDDGTIGRHTVDVFDTARLARTPFNPATGNYEQGHDAKEVYLAGGAARVFYDDAMALPRAPGQDFLHVFLRIGDHLGSSTAVIERATSELVSRSSSQAFGAIESDYRPSRWGAARDVYKFTGKEEDIEVGLTYFGARYYVPHLGRWASADPLTIHALGSDLNPYAYVGGRALSHVDPLGLAPEEKDPPPNSLPPMDDTSKWSAPPNNGLLGKMLREARAGSRASNRGWSQELADRFWDVPPLPLSYSFLNPSNAGSAGGTPAGEIAIGSAVVLPPAPVVDAAKYPHLARSVRNKARADQIPEAAVKAMAAMIPILAAEMAAGALAAEASVARGGPSASSYVYQLVNEAGEPVYYGLSNNPVVRLGQHARMPPGPFNGMQVISEALPLPQAQALETSLIQQANAEGRFIYNIAGSSISPTAPVAVPPTIFPNQSLLNPRLYIPR